MEIEENDGREPRPTSENQEISKEPTPQNKPERQRPAYRATREGGGYKLDSNAAPSPLDHEAPSAHQGQSAGRV